ncbi:MAG: DUF2279 domain-containing protein [Candidatus Marinimicrobia bacterium]|nr:DUF2279 domain-containing protein [Candidatus Neomarinimicrobiota bacterium]MBT7377905.1 DUF2279 domain-containing protein [Candidatus Neomarinimicrobiota bacterium]
MININDSLSTLQNKNLHLSIEKFTYAGHRKYTFTGGTPYKESYISKESMIKTSLFLILSQYLAYKYVLQPGWWFGEEEPFRYETASYAKLADKIGHAYSGYLLSNLNTDLLISSGLSWNKATLYGGLISFIQMFQLEYKDGVAPEYGFSKYDIYSNTTGILYYYLQHYIPFFQNFTPKYLYNYSKLIRDAKINSMVLIENYEEITFFMSINVKNLLPNHYKKMWLNGLDLAVGYNVKGFNVIDELPYPLKENYYFGLDLNILSILPNHNSRWHWVAQTLSFIKLPSPMIEFTDDGEKHHLLYPLK